MKIDFVSVQIDQASGVPYGMDRDGRWWYWDRGVDLWREGRWTAPAKNDVMLTPPERYE